LRRAFAPSQYGTEVNGGGNPQMSDCKRTTGAVQLPLTRSKWL
jgi:hypothetical protein